MFSVRRTPDRMGWRGAERAVETVTPPSPAEWEVAPPAHFALVPCGCGRVLQVG